MDDLQYLKNKMYLILMIKCFKPCYKWMTFNTFKTAISIFPDILNVLNLVINGWPSIQAIPEGMNKRIKGFKPCYKWMTFNTISNGNIRKQNKNVLNLVINGWPSILSDDKVKSACSLSFKPCYKWMTFNTNFSNWNCCSWIYYCFKPCYKWMTFNTKECSSQ